MGCQIKNFLVSPPPVIQMTNKYQYDEGDFFAVKLFCKDYFKRLGDASDKCIFLTCIPAATGHPERLVIFKDIMLKAEVLSGRTKGLLFHLVFELHKVQGNASKTVRCYGLPFLWCLAVSNIGIFRSTLPRQTACIFGPT
jgi:hypothetical protein